MTARQLQVGIAATVAVVVVSIFIIGNPFGAQSMLPFEEQAIPAGQLVAQDMVVGSGAAARAGDRVRVNYTGQLSDGTVFDSSVGRAPFEFTLGRGEVIAGWDRGLEGMRVGGKRLLIIPPDMGYGALQYGPIPPNSVLIFEVELLEVASAAQ